MGVMGVWMANIVTVQCTPVLYTVHLYCRGWNVMNVTGVLMGVSMANIVTVSERDQ